MTIQDAWRALRAWCSHGVGRWVYSIVFLSSVGAFLWFGVPFLFKVMVAVMFVGAMTQSH